MKTLAIMTIGVLMLYSCVDYGGSKIVYSMINNTDKEVRVLGFINGVELPFGKADEIAIDPNSDYAIARYSGIENDGKTFYSLIAVDSVRVIFNDERVKIYTLQGVGASSDASIFFGDGSDGDYRHIITEEDYDTAEECMGSCE